MHADLAAKQHRAMEAQLKEAQKKAQLAQQNADLAISQRGALEAELRKAQDEKAQLAQHVADLAASRHTAATTPSQEEAEPADEDADLGATPLESGQTQPPNPGQNAKTPPLIQALNSSVQSTRP
jgi:chromosome segregation ATPase